MKEKKPCNQHPKQIKPQQNRAVTSADAIEVKLRTGWRRGVGAGMQALPPISGEDHDLSELP